MFPQIQGDKGSKGLAAPVPSLAGGSFQLDHNSIACIPNIKSGEIDELAANMSIPRLYVMDLIANMGEREINTFLRLLDAKCNLEDQISKMLYLAVIIDEHLKTFNGVISERSYFRCKNPKYSLMICTSRHLSNNHTARVIVLVSCGRLKHSQTWFNGKCIEETFFGDGVTNKYHYNNLGDIVYYEQRVNNQLYGPQFGTTTDGYGVTYHPLWADSSMPRRNNKTMNINEFVKFRRCIIDSIQDLFTDKIDGVIKIIFSYLMYDLNDLEVIVV
jgi:hypothetical protein